MPLSVRRWTRSRDGTAVAYRTGGVEGGAPVVALVGPPAAPEAVWQPQLDYLGERFRFLAWEHRGLGESPRGGPAQVSDHVDDLCAVLAAEHVDRCAVVGLGAGVRLALEAARELGERLLGVVTIAGLTGPTAGMVRLAVAAERLARRLGARRRGEALRWLVRAPRGRRWLLGALRRTGVVGVGIEDDVLEGLADALGTVDLDAYIAALGQLDSTKAFEFAARIEAPALVVAGDRDPLMPPARTQQLARLLPRSEVLMVRGAHHFVGLEFPDLVNLRIERFFDDAGL
jgi:pimeloyl-ACP methyl ester carboxylesterase